LSGDDGAIISQAVDTLAHHERRCLIDAMLSAWPTHWERRARALDDARPRAGDFFGRASREELRAQYDRLTDAARACRARAEVSPLELVEPDVDTVLGEVASHAA
jgi:hypothetical protein